ncbi:MAG: hypothetical protein NTY22_09785 [Proteobacteria bacterium]|nr:hypothetical protein [Pseudomonadota bacterium]
MKYLLSSLLFCSIAVSAAPSTQEELCGTTNYDYNIHFGPQRVQFATRDFYAFAVAVLLEEELYFNLITKQPRSFFENNNISVIDVQRCDMEAGHGYGEPSDHEYSFYSMECALYDGGACLEKDAVFDTKQKKSIISQDLRFSEFMSLYDEWHNRFDHHNYPVGYTRDKTPLGFITEKTEYFCDYLPCEYQPGKKEISIDGDGYNTAHFSEAFQDAKNRVHFLNKVLTTKNCEKNRYQFANRELVRMNFIGKKDNNNETKIKVIKDVFSQKRSAIVTFELPKNFIFGVEASGELVFAAVVTGMRMNKTTGKCELYFRSPVKEFSGKPELLTGWHDAESILNKTVSIKYLKEVDPGNYENAKKAFQQTKKDIAKNYEQEKFYLHQNRW